MRLVVSDDDPHTAYIYLSSHPGAGSKGVAVKQVCVADHIADYKGQTFIWILILIIS